MTDITTEQLQDIAAGGSPGLALANGTLQFDVLRTLTATALELSILSGVTALAAELNYLDLTTLGTGAASKAVVLDAGDDYIWPTAGFLTYGGTQVTATGAEMNLLDGSAAANAVASKAAVLDANKAIITAANNGAAGTNCTAVEYGDGFHHTTVITLTSVAATIGDNVSLAGGAIIYTFPAGAYTIKSATLSVGITLTTGTPTTDDPELGLGSLIGSGAVATLGAVDAAAEDISAGPVSSVNMVGTAALLTSAPALAFEASESHVVNMNWADAWADVDNTAATMSGTVVIEWTHLPV
jgi:hypothetical protein